MKKTIPIIIFLLAIIACQNNGNQKLNSINELEKSNKKLVEDANENKPEIQDSRKSEIREEKVESKIEEIVLEDLSIKLSVENISYKGISFKDSKITMSKIMGIPDSIIEPKYECGPFSEDWQEMKFYQYFFGNMNYIVYKDLAEIQNIRFVEFEELKINGELINSTMSIEQIAEKLRIEFEEGKYSKDYILIYPKETLDEHYILKFKENKLYQFDRFEPC